ncbi:MAG TPA: hypothetical protein PKC69_06830 [Chitinophagaceae bacterium]|nr:hypothetical protein [Chitinophagaceae bacterium]
MKEEYIPYCIAEQTGNSYQLRLKKRYSLTMFILLRVLPWLILVCAFFSADAIRDAAGQPWFGIYYFMLLGVAGWLLFARYPYRLSFSPGQFSRRVNMFYFTWEEEEELNENSSVEVKRVRGYRSEAWVFYLYRDGARKKLFHVPIFLSDNKNSRDNLIRLFKEVSGVKQVALKE